MIWDGPWKIFGQFRWAANFFVCPRLGHQTKTHVNYILYKDINNKSKQNYPNYQMQMMLFLNANDAMQQHANDANDANANDAMQQQY